MFESYHNLTFSLSEIIFTQQGGNRDSGYITFYNIIDVLERKGFSNLIFSQNLMLIFGSF